MNNKINDNGDRMILKQILNNNTEKPHSFLYWATFYTCLIISFIGCFSSVQTLIGGLVLLLITILLLK